jgi:hypothetical protein
MFGMSKVAYLNWLVQGCQQYWGGNLNLPLMVVELELGYIRCQFLPTGGFMGPRYVCQLLFYEE